MCPENIGRANLKWVIDLECEITARIDEGIGGASSGNSSSIGMLMQLSKCSKSEYNGLNSSMEDINIISSLRASILTLTSFSEVCLGLCTTWLSSGENLFELLDNVLVLADIL